MGKGRGTTAWASLIEGTGPHQDNVSNLLLQHTQGKEGTAEHLNTIILKKPPLGLLLRSSDTDLEDNYMQLPTAN